MTEADPAASPPSRPAAAAARRAGIVLRTSTVMLERWDDVLAATLAGRTRNEIATMVGEWLGTPITRFTVMKALAAIADATGRSLPRKRADVLAVLAARLESRQSRPSPPGAPQTAAPPPRTGPPRPAAPPPAPPPPVVPLAEFVVRPSEQDIALAKLTAELRKVPPRPPAGPPKSRDQS